jgi:hypothetical protein
VRYNWIKTGIDEERYAFPKYDRTFLRQQFCSYFLIRYKYTEVALVKISSKEKEREREREIIIIYSFVLFLFINIIFK